MTGQPQVDIRVCGMSVATDQPALSNKSGETSTEALLSLAEQRTAAVRDYLILALGAQANRLIPCLPAFEEGKSDSKPRADLEVLGKIGPRTQSK